MRAGWTFVGNKWLENGQRQVTPYDENVIEYDVFVVEDCFARNITKNDRVDGTCVYTNQMIKDSKR